MPLNRRPACLGHCSQMSDPSVGGGCSVAMWRVCCDDSG